MTDVPIYDWTHHEPNPPPRLVRNGEKRYRTAPAGGVYVRDPKSVDGICIHQTACVFGPHADPQKRHERAFDIPVHAVAFTDAVVFPYPALWYLYSANGWNARSVSLEIEGEYPGNGTGEMSDVQVQIASEALTGLVLRARAEGCPIRYIWAHRQSAADRRNDPGQEIWQKIVLEHAVPNLHLITQPTVAIRDGFPIPTTWDPAGHGGL